MEDPGEYKAKLPEEYKERIDLLMAVDNLAVANIVQCAFIAGMELAMRICRNRAKDCKTEGWTIKEYEAFLCAQIIRNVQVEIGAGRMPRPQFTKEELDEMDRIS
jgi:hypothetical protein